MANQTSRGGKKRGTRKEGGKQHQGVRPGSTARARERGNKAPRNKIVPDA